MDSLDRFPPQGRSSLAKDFLEGRQVELEGMNGTVSRMGREAGVPHPHQRRPLRHPQALGPSHRELPVLTNPAPAFRSHRWT